MSFCTSCGSKQNETSRFCSVCGAKSEIAGKEESSVASREFGEAQPVLTSNSTVAIVSTTQKSNRRVRVAISILMLISILSIQILGIFQSHFMGNSLTQILEYYSYGKWLLETQLETGWMTIIVVLLLWVITPLLVLASSIYSLIAKRASILLPLLSILALTISWVVHGIYYLQSGWYISNVQEFFRFLDTVLLGWEGREFSMSELVSNVIDKVIFGLSIILIVVIAKEKRRN